MTLRGEIVSAARALASRTRPVEIMEFFKWFLFFYGVIGLVAYDSFLGWLKTLNLSWFDGDAVYGILSYEIVGNIPLAGFIFAIVLFSGCIVAALQRYMEKIVGLGTLNETMKNLFGLSKTLDETNSGLLELSVSLSETEKKMSEETMKFGNLRQTLIEANETVSELRERIKALTNDKVRLERELTVAQEKLEYVLSPNLAEISGIGLKTAEKLGDIGIYRTSDLLKIAPDELAEKMGVSRKIVAKWLEQAAKYDNGRRH